MNTICSILLITSSVYPQVHFDEFFYEKTLRMDYFHTGNNKEDTYSIDELIEEPYWGGSKENLIDIFNYGKYKVELYEEDQERIKKLYQKEIDLSALNLSFLKGRESSDWNFSGLQVIRVIS
ncbi:MAG: hypothetical protein IIB08_09525 [Bacteroidetes bacterium]|nr:hypothetical protein [Bacteroidota bacterium]